MAPFAIAPHAVQDRCLGPDACIVPRMITPMQFQAMPALHAVHNFDRLIPWSWPPSHDATKSPAEAGRSTSIDEGLQPTTMGDVLSPSPPMQSKTDCSPKTKTDCSPKTVALAPSSLLAAMRRCLAHHAVQDRSLGPDACIHAFALTPYRCAMSRYFAIASRPLPSPSPPMQSKTDCSPKSKTDCSPKTVALAPMI